MCKNQIINASVVGHSLGGYIAGHFLRLYPGVVNKLVLLSPAGVNYPPKDSKKRLEDVIDNQNFIFKLFAKDIADRVFIEKVLIFEPFPTKYKQSPFNNILIETLSPALLKGYYSHKRLVLTSTQSDLFTKLFTIMKSFRETSEKCLGYFFFYGPYSKKPLMPVFSKYSMKKNIEVLFGDKDWMDKEKTQRMIEELGLDVDVEILENCEHQINYQQPLFVAKKIVLSRDNTFVLNDLDTREQIDFMKKRDERGFVDKDYKILNDTKKGLFQPRMKIFKLYYFI